ncbi:NADH-quinone oxidoreductase subunit 5 family protein [Halomonas piscis]|uniref:NADH-quinone oxidoreductase subunit 5 family protein n=1 Tax=Halomonas piscis TaxID=3031727 RepID=UPI0028A1D604|nr:proton-conducting transporter membrane subunit [Halomonas piscis]
MMLWIVPLLPVLMAPVIYLGGRREGRIGVTLLALSALMAVIGTLVSAMAGHWQGSYALNAALVLQLGVGPSSQFVALAIPIMAFPVLLFAGAYEQAPLGRLLAVMVAFVGAMELLVLAQDMVTLLVAWELIGAYSWALVSHHWRDRDRVKNAGQVFLVTRFGDLGLYIAAAAVFAGSGGFGYQQLAGLEGSLLQVAAAGILLAAVAKSAQVPFSAWLFAAMSGPVSVSALLHAATLVAAGMYVLARLQPLLADAAWLMPAVMLIGLTTALLGAVTSLVQSHAKKLLAASTSAQYGLMWVAIGAGFPGVALLHFLSHGFFKAGLFLTTGVAERQARSYQLANMRLGGRVPTIALLGGIFSLALAGMVPLGAAWTKEQIISAAYTTSPWLAAGVALAGGLSAVYATRFQLTMFGPVRFGRTRQRKPPLSEACRFELLALSVLAALTLGLSLFWWPEARRWLRQPGWELADGHLWLLAVSLVLVVLGMALGAMLVQRGRLDVQQGWKRSAFCWWGLEPLTLGAGATLVKLSDRLARFDRDVLERATRLLSRQASQAASVLARRDTDGVDASLRGSAAAVTRIANVGATAGEALLERLPGSLSGLVNRGGGRARQAQSGQTHHYYAGMAIGFAVLLTLLLLGDAL